MADAIEPTVEATVGVSPNEAVHKAEESAEQHTPPIAQPPTPESTVTNPATSHAERLDAIEDLVSGLAVSITVLTDTVKGLVKDEAPRKRIPWTHRGGNRQQGES